MQKPSENTYGFRMCQTLKKHCKTIVKTCFLYFSIRGMRLWWCANSSQEMHRTLSQNDAHIFQLRSKSIEIDQSGVQDRSKNDPGIIFRFLE